MNNNKVYYMDSNRIRNGYKIGESKTKEDEIIIEEIQIYGDTIFGDRFISKNKSEVYNKEQVVGKIKDMLDEKENRLSKVENKYRESIQILEKEKQKLNNYKVDTVDTAFNSFKLKMKNIHSFKKAEELLKKYRDVYVGYTRKIKALGKKFAQAKKERDWDNRIVTDVMQYLKDTLNEIMEEE